MMILLLAVLLNYLINKGTKDLRSILMAYIKRLPTIDFLGLTTRSSILYIILKEFVIDLPLQAFLQKLARVPYKASVQDARVCTFLYNVN